MDRYRVRAKNTATQSDNKIHDDVVAAKLGFTGGLVPGVDVYAYLCHIPAERWGRSWLERGTMSARFGSPVYDGDSVEVEAVDAGDDALDLTLYDSKGDACATGRAALPIETPAADAIDLLPLAGPPPERPPASAESLSAIDVMGSLEVGFHSDRVVEYLDDVREALPLFRAGGCAHPAWLLRQANYILGANVKLGPWIHVSSDMHHVGLAADGDHITVRGRVVATYEKKGHRFVDLDVQWVAGADRVIMRGRHTAIYEPRGVAAVS